MPWILKDITRQEISQDRLSVAALIAANTIPLIGVLLFGWSVFEVVVLYWFENVVLGVINVLKMICCSPDPDQINLPELLAKYSGVNNGDKLTKQQAQAFTASPWAKHGGKLFFVPFFVVHYGLFCLVHGVFVFVLLGGGGPFNNGANLHGGPEAFLRHDLSTGLVIAAAALAASHLVSFFVNYLGKGEYRRTILPVLMIQPYARIVVLHIAIILGAFTILVLGSPIFLLVLLVVGKTLLDLSLHLRQRRSSQAAGEDPVAWTVPIE